jgi:predicted TIM-barrel fold metal-dependent hydrolase
VFLCGKENLGYGKGFFMDDARYGIPMLEKARELNLQMVSSHRGLPLLGLEYEYSRPEDIVRVGCMFPDLTFLCFHSGFEPGVAEGPYKANRARGVDRLVRPIWRMALKQTRGMSTPNLAVSGAMVCANLPRPRT